MAIDYSAIVTQVAAKNIMGPTGKPVAKADDLMLRDIVNIANHDPHATPGGTATVREYWQWAQDNAQSSDPGKKETATEVLKEMNKLADPLSPLEVVIDEQDTLGNVVRTPAAFTRPEAKKELVEAVTKWTGEEAEATTIRAEGAFNRNQALMKSMTKMLESRYETNFKIGEGFTKAAQRMQEKMDYLFDGQMKVSSYVFQLR